MGVGGWAAFACLLYVQDGSNVHICEPWLRIAPALCQDLSSSRKWTSSLRGRPLLCDVHGVLALAGVSNRSNPDGPS